MVRPKRYLLTDEAKDFATLCFARFMRPGQVIAAIEDRYGVTIDKRVMQNYDPTTAKGQSLGKKRKQLFAVTRERFLKELEDIPIANRAVRLQQLQLAFETMVDKDDLGMALKVLEQASKEAGNFHSNEKHVRIDGRLEIEEVSEDEMRNGLAAAIAEMIAGEQAKAAPAEVTKH